MKIVDYLKEKLGIHNEEKNIIYHSSEQHKGVLITTKIYNDGSFKVFSELGEIYKEFYNLSEEIINEKDTYKKLMLCEKSYLILADFVKMELENDSDLPPCINCRDIGPDLYMREGEWDKAEEAIKKCISANAYYPKDGTEELKTLYKFHKISDNVLELLNKKPGFMQKDVYKELNVTEEDKIYYKYFLRCSHQIRKEKYKSTNKLYAK